MKTMDSVKTASAGDRHSLIVKSDHTLWSTGNNFFGQLGDGGQYNNSNIPIKVLDNVDDISAGYGHSLALRKDNTVWGAGWGSSGQLGICCFPNVLLFTKIALP
jgi:alpha-tubulin suppressor-like RCC1 family protein